jgi:hypothetical protein
MWHAGLTAADSGQLTNIKGMERTCLEIGIGM